MVGIIGGIVFVVVLALICEAAMVAALDALGV